MSRPNSERASSIATLGGVEPAVAGLAERPLQGTQIDAELALRGGANDGERRRVADLQTMVAQEIDQLEAKPGRDLPRVSGTQPASPPQGLE